MTNSFWQNESWAEPIPDQTQFDVLIVGAGIAGLSTAYWIEQSDPTLKICIVDRGLIGSGASGRNAGFVTCGSAEHFEKLFTQFGLQKATEIWKFSELNRDLLLEHIIQDDAELVDFKMTGSCTVSPSEDAWSRYHQIYSRMDSAGLDVELITDKELERDYGVNGFYGAIQYKNDGFVHPLKLLKKIRSKLRNTSFYLNHAVEKINEHDLHVTLEVRATSASSIKLLTAKKVAFCLNGFAGNLLPEFKNVIRPQRGQILLTEKLPQFVRGPCYLTKHLCYFRQLPTGELLVGGFRNVDIENENTDLEEITDVIQNALTHFTKNYFKQTGDSIRIERRWSGIMGFSPDGQMIIGSLSRRPRSFIMTGCSGHGMGLSFHAAKVLAGAMSGGTIPDHLDLKRLEKKTF